MLKFGFKRAEKEKEKLLFPFPHMIMGARPNTPRQVSKFWLHESRELLKWDIRENKLSWLYDESTDSDHIYLINVTSVADSVSPVINVNLDLDFNNKVLHETITKVYKVDPDSVNAFKLTEIPDIEGLPAVRIDLITVADAVENTIKYPVGNTIGDMEDTQSTEQNLAHQDLLEEDMHFQ